MELSKLNRHFGDFCFQLKDAAIGKQLAKYCKEAVVGIGGVPVMAVPVAAGADGHGVARIQALSLATIINWLMSQVTDLTRCTGSLVALRAIPRIPINVTCSIATARSIAEI